MAAPTDFFPAAAMIVAGQQIERDKHVGGVCWSGLTSPSREVETIENVALRLEREANSRTEWRITPRGRFYICIEDLRETGFHEEAERLYGLWSRSISDEREPLNVGAVAACLVILDGLTVSTAREAQAALHELLLGTRPAMLIAAE